MRVGSRRRLESYEESGPELLVAGRASTGCVLHPLHNPKRLLHLFEIALRDHICAWPCCVIGRSGKEIACVD